MAVLKIKSFQKGSAAWVNKAISTVNKGRYFLPFHGLPWLDKAICPRPLNNAELVTGAPSGGVEISRDWKFVFRCTRRGLWFPIYIFFLIGPSPPFKFKSLSFAPKIYIRTCNNPEDTFNKYFSFQFPWDKISNWAIKHVREPAFRPSSGVFSALATMANKVVPKFRAKKVKDLKSCVGCFVGRSSLYRVVLEGIPMAALINNFL